MRLVHSSGDLCMLVLSLAGFPSSQVVAEPVADHHRPPIAPTPPTTLAPIPRTRLSRIPPRCTPKPNNPRRSPPNPPPIPSNPSPVACQCGRAAPMPEPGFNFPPLILPPTGEGSSCTVAIVARHRGRLDRAGPTLLVRVTRAIYM